MPRTSSGPKVRLNLEVSEAVRAKLEELRERTGAESFVEVIRRSLAIYDFLRSEKEEGGTLVLKGRDGREREVVVL
jgi:hypothetical protein